MEGTVKNKRGRKISTNEEMPPLDGRRFVIALLPSDEGYIEIMEGINDVCDVCSEE